MKTRAAIALLAILPALAVAQPIGGSGVKLANVGSAPSAKAATMASGTLTLQPADATHPGVITTGTQTFAGNKTLTGNLALSAGNLVMTAGIIQGGFATPQKIDMNAGANGIRFATGSVLGGDVYISDLGGTTYAHSSNNGFFIYGSESPVVITHAAQSGIGGGTNGVALEFGRVAAAGTGILAVSFATAFGAVPSCDCTDENAVPVTCGITVAPSVSAVTFAITSARADFLDWRCIGVK